ncbi:hypothetical protein AXF42_Ash006364 [Apostasia shenzhenica]|uniref:MYND-type domain-containing protein n=1 Tax=Apostasia shenzhenica TaxID=1088818 RepID=A0A2I0AYV6_9ASPA|nr:hypothetical protein AXF42_Ash006364 [Apostasia shenzhenica]
MLEFCFEMDSRIKKPVYHMLSHLFYLQIVQTLFGRPIMECAAKGRGDPCFSGRPRRRCGLCGAVAYCSSKHQMLDWNNHREECARLAQQMQRADFLSDFPFSFSVDAEHTELEKWLTRCSFLISIGLHLKPMWICECSCWHGSIYLDNNSRLIDEWSLPSSLCPCSEPRSSIRVHVDSWKDYYLWRCLPFYSPAALILHWPLTVYHCIQLSALQSLISKTSDQLHIHYLGPYKELCQLAAFAELRALIPGVQLHIDFVGPAVPQSRDGETIILDKYAKCSCVSCSCKSSCEDTNMGSCHMKSTVTLKLHRGFYHDKCEYMDSHPDLIIAPNAGIAAYPSWSQSIDLINKISIPAIFTDYCEEAAFLASQCIRAVTGRPLTIPIQVNPFRQPLLMEDQALFLPCYSNCFLFGM